MNRKIVCLFLALAFSLSGFASSEQKPQVGVVNFATCMTESKYGKQEQASFEALKKQLSSLLEDTEKQINEIAATFNDPEKMDGINPEAEEELKNKFRTLNEEMNRYQNQYYQVLNQANMKTLQAMSAKIQAASEKIAKEKKLTMVINKEACFFYTPVLDVTHVVVAEMDKNFELSATKNQTVEAENSAAKNN